jgi:hypothetical protein
MANGLAAAIPEAPIANQTARQDRACPFASCSGGERLHQGPVMRQRNQLWVVSGYSSALRSVQEVGNNSVEGVRMLEVRGVTTFRNEHEAGALY